MGYVKLYDLDALRQVQGLQADRALGKMNNDLEIYSTLLDKFLNQVPRTIPRLRQYMKAGKMSELEQEVKDLRIDLADIFAQGMLERANILQDAVVKGDLKKCLVMREPFITALQTLNYEIKQCRTQDLLENAEEAAIAAAEMDIGASMISNPYSTIPKTKFIELYKRIDAGLLDKALNLANVLKAMGYDNTMHNLILGIIEELNRYKQSNALALARKLIVLLGGVPPESFAPHSTLLVIDDTMMAAAVREIVGKRAMVLQAKTPDEAVSCIRGDLKPNFILINDKMRNYEGVAVVERLKQQKLVDIPLGVAFTSPTSQDILKARAYGATEFFILPLIDMPFLEKIEKYLQTAPSV